LLPDRTRQTTGRKQRAVTDQLKWHGFDERFSVSCFDELSGSRTHNYAPEPASVAAFLGILADA
jgi:hypothetical protein